MKRIYVYLAALTMAFTTMSCDDDVNNEDIKPVRIDKFDELTYLQNNIVQVDENGKFVCRINGLPLKSDTTVVYLGKDDVKQAEDTFLSWLAPNTVVNHVNNGFEVNLTDGKGTPQGKVYFRSADNATTFRSHPVLAEVTFSPETDIKHVTKVVFLPHEAWPVQGKQSKFFVGDVIRADWFTPEGAGNLWLCVREATEGQSGLLVYISHKKGCWDKWYCKYFASPSTAREVSAILRQQWDAFAVYFKSAETELVKGDYHWINDTKDMVFETGIYSIRLSDGNIDWWGTVWKNPSWRYIEVQTFGMEDVEDTAAE